MQKVEAIIPANITDTRYLMIIAINTKSICRGRYIQRRYGTKSDGLAFLWG